jgi:hypothetical protein
MTTKAKLEQVAKAFNDLMKLDPPILFGKKVTMKSLLANIKEASEQLNPDDKFPQEIVETLLEVNVFVKDEAESRIIPAPTPKEKDKKPAKKKPPAGHFIVHLLCDNPEITNEAIQKRLDKKGYVVAPSTIGTQRADTMKVINYLQEKGRWS